MRRLAFFWIAVGVVSPCLATDRITGVTALEEHRPFTDEGHALQRKLADARSGAATKGTLADLRMVSSLLESAKRHAKGDEKRYRVAAEAVELWAHHLLLGKRLHDTRRPSAKALERILAGFDPRKDYKAVVALVEDTLGEDDTKDSLSVAVAILGRLRGKHYQVEFVPRKDRDDFEKAIERLAALDREVDALHRRADQLARRLIPNRITEADRREARDIREAATRQKRESGELREKLKPLVKIEEELRRFFDYRVEWGGVN